MKRIPHELVRDVFIIVLFILFAVIIVKSGAISNLKVAPQYAWLACLFVGMFYTSMFTTIPALVVLISFTNEYGILTVMLFGGIGAMVGDFIIFRFIRDNVSEHLLRYFRKRYSQGTGFFQKKLFTFFAPIVGAVIIMSPFPDEIGLALMGFSKMKTPSFMALSFVLNSSSIAIFATVLGTIVF